MKTKGKTKKLKPRDDYQVIHGAVVLKGQVRKVVGRDMIETEPCPFCAQVGRPRKHKYDFNHPDHQTRSKVYRGRKMFGRFATKCPDEAPTQIWIRNGIYQVSRFDGYYIEDDEEFFS